MGVSLVGPHDRGAPNKRCIKPVNPNTLGDADNLLFFASRVCVIYIQEMLSVPAHASVKRKEGMCVYISWVPKM